MNVFCCVIRVDGAPVLDAYRVRFSRAHCCRGLTLDYVEGAGLWGFIGGDAAGRRPMWARDADRIAIGTARLDHPSDVQRCGSGKRVRTTDLTRILEAWARTGRDAAMLLGDFGYVVYDERRRSAVGVRDAFGVDTLYYRTFPGFVAFTCRADLLADGEGYDRRYFAEYLARAGGATRTPFTGVFAVPAAHTVEWSNGALQSRRYWSGKSFAQPSTGTSTALVDEFRERFRTAVCTRLVPDSPVWAQLSGGLDSSSVVSMAGSLATGGVVPRGLAGTVTLVDSHGTGGDERVFSDSVVRATGLRNEQVADFGFWQGDGREPPWTDQPTPAYLMYARDRRLAEVVRAAGGEALLTGYGSDQLLGGSAVFLADWMVRGRWPAVLRESTRWAMTGRVSFWRFALHNVAMPLLPPAILRRLLPVASVPSWVSLTAIREYALGERTAVQLAYGGKPGEKYSANILRAVDAMPDVLALHAVIRDLIEERHPFLYRPLVELALGLPAAMCAQPMARKWILREAMRDALPEPVRTRPGKGSIDGSLAWTLAQRSGSIRALIQRSVLAEMGLVDPAALSRAVEHAAHGTGDERAAIARTLAVECWLQVRSGRLVWLDERTEYSGSCSVHS